MSRLLILWFLLVLPISSFASAMDQLQDEIAKQNFRQAAFIGSEIVKNQPNNLQARFLTALALQNSDQIHQAEFHYTHLIKTHPELPEPRNNLAVIYLELGKHDEAAGLLIASLNTHPSYATTWKNLSDLYKGMASDAYRKALGEEKPASVIDNIQLSAINSLHSLSEAKSEAQIESQAKQATIDNAILIKRVEAAVRNIDAVEKAQASFPVTSSVEAAPIVPEVSTSVSAAPEQANADPVESLLNWAQAWSNKDIETYIDAYTVDFKGRESGRNIWLNQRRTRINRADKISVQLSKIEIKSRSESKVTLDVQQSFKTSSYQDNVLKRFNLIKINGLWKISGERTLAVL